MDRRLTLKLKMEEALERGNLAEAISHLDGLISASYTSQLTNVFKNHSIMDRPTLHYLARLTFQEEDIPFLDKLIRNFKDFGYDINKKATDHYVSGKRTILSFGFTALHSSIEHKNLILTERLLQHGARTDIRNGRGYLPVHWAVCKGDLKCLEKLIEYGGPSMVAALSLEKSENNDAHPLLHLAVETGHLEIVTCLLSKEEELGVKVNEKVVYKHVSATDVFNKSGPKAEKAFTPLGRALHDGTTPIIETLLRHPGTKPSRFTELHALLEDGDTEKAFSIMKYFSDEQLSTDKIQNRWAPHAIHPQAFSDEYYAEFTKKVILEYARRGWNVNCWNNASIFTVPYLDQFVLLTKFNLLHLACLNEGHEIIKMLVEELGMDVNCNSELELTPLHILLMMEQWESATYLIEKGADLNARGRFVSGGDQQFTQFVRRNLTTGVLELNSNFSSVELLIRMGRADGLQLLGQVLARPDVVWQGANEFHLAIEGQNPTYVLKVLRKIAKVITKNDVSWMIYCARENGWTPEEMPTLLMLLCRLENDTWNPSYKNVLLDLIKLMVKLGYNLNISWKNPYSSGVEKDPLIFHILRLDMCIGTNVFLQTILKYDHLQLNVTNEEGLNPVAYLLQERNKNCFNGMTTACWEARRSERSFLKAIQLLVTNGLDVSGVLISTANFKYRQGYYYKGILKTLYCAGAGISDDFFSSPSICSCGAARNDVPVREIAELKEWKDEFDRKTGFTLQHISRLRIRKMLKCVGDLKMLDVLSRSVKEAILATAYL